MTKAKRGFGSRRLVATLLSSSLAIALASCGGTDGASSAGAAASTTSPAIADTSMTSTSGPPSGNSGSSGDGSASPAQSTTPASSSSVTLGWQAPTQNTDGSPLADLAGYKIRYGTAPDNYTQTVAVTNSSLSRYVVDNLPPGIYYFTITAYNSAGLESDPSKEASITVN